MATTPAVTPGVATSEFTLAKFGSFAGLALILGSVALSVFHPIPQLSADLLKYGVWLMGTTGVAYGLFRSALKYGAALKPYQPIAEAVAAGLPGPVGVEARHILPLLEKAMDTIAALQAQLAPPPSPASVAVAAAQATPVAPAGSPAAPSAA